MEGVLLQVKCFPVQPHHTLTPPPLVCFPVKDPVHNKKSQYEFITSRLNFLTKQKGSFNKTFKTSYFDYPKMSSCSLSVTQNITPWSWCLRSLKQPFQSKNVHKFNNLSSLWKLVAFVRNMSWNGHYNWYMSNKTGIRILQVASGNIILVSSLCLWWQSWKTLMYSTETRAENLQICE